jgi:hypothetical protein
MDHDPSGGAGRSGRRPGAASPDQRPDQEVLYTSEEVLPLAGSLGTTLGPAIPGPAPALDLDAVSDYVPALDDGLVLDYGPVPDNEAARDYGKALGCDAVPGLAPGAHLAPHLAQAADPVPDPGSAAAPDPALDPGPPAPALGMAAAHVPAAASPSPAAAHVPAAASPSPAAAHVPPAEDLWALDLAAAPVSPATYWRRRLVALVVGIAVLTVLGWAVSGVLHGTGRATGHGVKPSAGPGAARGRPGAAHGHKGGNRSGRHSVGHSGRSGHAAEGNAPQSLPVSATGRARTISATAGHPTSGALSGVSDVLTIAGAPQQRGSAASRTPPHRRGARAPERRAVARAPDPRVPACGRGDVVLSLVSPRYWYQRGRWPLFGVDAVSTASRPCRFNMGSRFATVVVTSGRTRIWGSADCAHGTGSQSVVLSRGVPAVRWIYWGRATSSPGCRSPHKPVRQGAYAAVAFDGQLSSQVMVFILGRAGTSLP